MSMNQNYDQISRRAYELFVKRGKIHGYDLADWLQAEKEISSKSYSPNTNADLMKSTGTVSSKRKK